MAIEAVLDGAADAARGFGKDKQLCILITLDIRNAFNSAMWEMIDGAVAGIGFLIYVRRLIRSYLSDRSILVLVDGSFVVRPMTWGVLRGSVLGPTL